MTLDNMYYLLISSIIITSIARKILTIDRLPSSGFFLIIFYLLSFLGLILVWVIPIAAVYKFGWSDGAILIVVSLFVGGFLSSSIIKNMYVYSIFILFALGIINSWVVVSSFISPKTYAECVLDKMPSAKTNAVAIEIKRACYSKYGEAN